MEYVRPCYNYKDCMQLVQYTKSMHIYGFSANHLQLKYKYQNKGSTLYINERPKDTRNILGFINNTKLWSTIKQPNCYQPKWHFSVRVPIIPYVGTQKDILGLKFAKTLQIGMTWDAFTLKPTCYLIFISVELRTRLSPLQLAYCT